MTTAETTSTRYDITCDLWEAGKSQWVAVPTIADRLSGEKVLTLERHWSLDESRWLDDSIVVLSLRKWPGNHQPAEVRLTVDCAARTARVGDVNAASFAELDAMLDSALTWPAPVPETPPEPTGLSARDRMRILIAVGIVLFLVLVANFVQALALSLLSGFDGTPMNTTMSATLVAADLVSRLVLFAGAAYVGTAAAPEHARVAGILSAFVALAFGAIEMFTSSASLTAYNYLSLFVLVAGILIGATTIRAFSRGRQT